MTRTAAQQNKTHQSLLVPLLNVTLNRTFTVADKGLYRLSLVGIAEQQRARWLQDSRVQCAVEETSGFVEHASSAVLLEARYPQPILQNDSANEDLTSLLGLINARLPFGLWAPFAELTAGAEIRTMRLGEVNRPLGMQRNNLNVSDYKTFRRYWRTVIGETRQSRRLRRAVGRLARATTSYWAEDVVVHAFIGLEALFADHTAEAGKTVKKVTRRLSTFVIPPDMSPTVGELTTLSERIGELYRIRHDILHGDLPDLAQTSDAAKDSIRLLRTAILIALEEGFGRLKDLPALAGQYDGALRQAQRQARRSTRPTR